MKKMAAIVLFLLFASPTFGQPLTIEIQLPTTQEVENLILEAYVSIGGEHSKEEIVVNIGAQKLRATITAENEVSVAVYWVFRSYNSGTLLDCPDGSKPVGVDKVCYFIINIALGRQQKNPQKEKEKMKTWLDSMALQSNAGLFSF